MRIAICGTNDLAVAIALNSLAPTILNNHDVAFFLCNDEYPQDFNELQLFLVDLPAQMLFPFVEKRTAIGDGSFLTPREIAQKHNVDLLIFDRKMWNGVARKVVEYAPDLLLMVRFPLIVKEPLLSFPHFGSYNIHSGPLPEYAGVAAPFRAMLNSEETIGCTLHRIDAGIDTGPIVGVKRLPLHKDKSLLWNICQLYTLGVGMFHSVVAQLSDGQVVAVREQDTSKRRYFKSPTDAEISEFFDKGNQLVKLGDFSALVDKFESHSNVLEALLESEPDFAKHLLALRPQHESKTDKQLRPDVK